MPDSPAASNGRTRPGALPCSPHPEAPRPLLERLQHAEPEALAELYRENRAYVFGFIRRRVSSESEAEDLTQDTFVEALRSIDRFEGRSSVRCWLLGIARHICLRFYRFGDRWMIGARSSTTTREPSLDARIEPRVEARRALERCEAALVAHRGAESRSIFHRRYAEGAPIRRIATDLGKSDDAVKASLRRSRRALERVVPRYEDSIA